MDIRLSRIVSGPTKGILVHLKGRMDSFNYEDLKDRVATLQKMGVRQIAFDLDGVDFIAVPNLLFLIKLSRQLRSKQGQLYFLGASQSVLKHFNNIGGLKDVVVCDDLETWEDVHAQGAV